MGKYNSYFDCFCNEYKKENHPFSLCL
jgi:hypothetical protein